MAPRRLLPLLRLISRLGLASGRSWTSFLAAAVSFLRKIATHPQVAELFRFIFLGTIVETGRKVAQKIADYTTDFFVVKAEFAVGDFAYDWVVNYLEHQRVWNESRSFKVVARNAASRPYHPSNLGKIDGHPDPIYEPATDQSSSLFRWQGYWMSISKSSPGLSHYDHPAPEQAAAGGSLVIAVWSRDRRILDEFVLAAREFYVSSRILPRRQLNPNGEPSGALLTARFEQSDVTYDWMLEYLRSSNALKDVMDYDVSTKQSNLGWGTGPKDSVRYMPSPNSLQRFLFTSPKTGRSTWLQVNIHTGIPSWESNRMIGGTIMITLHSSDRDVLEDLIDCAKEKYLEHGTSRVTVHLTDNLGRWAKTVTKSRRALSTLILPTNIKETILADAREFLASEKWYNLAGIPHRRGYLLYGAPGTGKSSTIHAVAGELGLEIYFISLASPGIDDFTLGQLISDTPSRCILLLEDIDCAFPSREDADEEDEEPEKDRNGNPVHPHEKLVMPPKSAVTLSGLLNVLDSVVSDEGRLTFATTNHIANLDAALIRAGRMDVKIKYGLATTEQIEQVFKVFFPVRGAHTDDEDLPPCTADELAEHASDFAAAIPSETYSIAQIQGYLLTKKQDPLGAVDGVDGWIAEQQAERRALAEQKRKWRAERARWLRGFDVPSRGADAWDRLWSVVEEGNTEDVGGAPAPGDHNGAAPF